MRSLKKPNVSTIILAILSLVFFVITSNINWGKNNRKSILEADGKGYYAYLPAIVIYNDLNFGFFDQIENEKYYDKNLFYDYRAYHNEKTINKYYCGTALALSPFFTLAHLLTKATGGDADGYSKLYLIFITVAALSYLLLGLYFLNKILALYTFKESTKSITILALAFGTHLFYYTIGESSMSHIYSFGFISMFLYFGKKYFINPEKRTFVCLSILFGLIVLIRPVNFILLLSIPFLSSTYSAFKKGISFIISHYYTLIFCVGLFVSISFIQLIIYKLSSGDFFLYSYTDEGFNFLSPHFFDILISYKKGLFLYTPVLLLSLTGFYWLFRKNKFEALTLLLFFIFINYILSSWWNWWYGGSFSSRVYVEYTPLFAILIAVSIENMKHKWTKSLYLIILTLLIILCQIQTFQYRYYQIHWEEMTKENYWDVFLRIDRL